MEGPRRPVALVVDDEPLDAAVFVRSFRREPVFLLAGALVTLRR